MEKELTDKTEKLVRGEGEEGGDGGGVRSVKVEEERVREAALSDDAVVEIAKLLVSLEEGFGKPQDFEWGIEEGVCMYTVQYNYCTRIHTCTLYMYCVYNIYYIIHVYMYTCMNTQCICTCMCNVCVHAFHTACTRTLYIHVRICNVHTHNIYMYIVHVSTTVHVNVHCIIYNVHVHFVSILSTGKLYCLQSRPIVTLPPSPFFSPSVPGSRTTLWDNSNIVESFAGVTSPLTFSFASRAYKEVIYMYHIHVHCTCTHINVHTVYNVIAKVWSVTY